MANRKGSRRFALFISVMVILLILCIALFIYGSMTNGIPRPSIPGAGRFALGTTLSHG